MACGARAIPCAMRRSASGSRGFCSSAAKRSNSAVTSSRSCGVIGRLLGELCALAAIWGQARDVTSGPKTAGEKFLAHRARPLSHEAIPAPRQQIAKHVVLEKRVFAFAQGRERIVAGELRVN